MSRKKQSGRPKHRQTSPAANPQTSARVASSRSTPVRRAQSDVAGFPVIAIVALFTLRYLVPAESAAAGETLWIVQLWLAAAALWCWIEFRVGTGRLGFDRYDAAVLGLAAAQGISALHVVATEGDKRAAVNMLWEWVALGVAFVLFRRILRTPEIRRQFLTGMISLAVALGGLGVWQHFVWFPETAKAYTELRQELDALTTTDNAGDLFQPAMRGPRIQQLRAELAEQGIPERGPARMLWEHRLTSSTEPFGFFALANTFAGILLVWLIVAVGFLCVKDVPLRLYGVLVPAAVLVAFCVVLTKSRSAWVGLAIGLGTLAVWYWRQPATRRSTSLKTLAVVLVVLVMIPVVATITGGLDWNVLAETLKSLQYRLEYWQATWDVICERPMLGTGPGNFRQHYLKHKLPQSSEEISDPHNLFLDIAANAGLLGFVALMGVLYVGVGVFRSAGRQNSDAPATGAPVVASHQASRPVGFINPVNLGIAGAFAMVVGYAVVLGQDIDNRILATAALWLVVTAAVSWGVKLANFSPAVYLAGILGLIVHLLGSGGISMPAVTQTALVLLACAAPALSGVPGTARVWAQRAGRLSLAFATLFGLCLLTATVPTAQASALTQLGDAAWVSNRNVALARTNYAAAVAADPLSSNALMRMAGLHFESWKLPGSDQRDFDRAVEFAQLAILHNPYDYNLQHILGRWYVAAVERTGNQEFSEKATQHLQLAADNYPTNPTVQAELALAWVAADQPDAAQNTAKTALQLDALNREAGHIDRLLSSQIIERLEALTGSASKPATKVAN